jgi:LPXTG-motif cell wall-anchored protein
MAQRKVLVGLAITIALLALPFALYAQETDPASLCYDAERLAAFGNGDFDTLLAVWADDAVQTIVVGDSVETYTGKDEIRAYWEELLAGGFSMEATVQSVEGNTVTAESKTWSNDTRALGVAPLVGTEVCAVQDGRVQSMTWTMSEESLAALGAALATLPQTGGESPPDYAWIMVLGGLVFAVGLGFRHLGRRARQGP